MIALAAHGRATACRGASADLTWHQLGHTVALGPSRMAMAHAHLDAAFEL